MGKEEQEDLWGLPGPDPDKELRAVEDKLLALLKRRVPPGATAVDPAQRAYEHFRFAVAFRRKGKPLNPGEITPLCGGL